jgi:hypothetical protein
MTDLEKLKKLYELLDKAEKLSGEFTGGYSNQFLSAQEFHSALSDSIVKLKSSENDEINKLYFWFAPTCSWDDLVGIEGKDLGNEIFELLSDLRKSFKIYSLVDLIIDYQKAVEKVISAFKNKFNRTDLLKACRSDKVIPVRGNLKEFGIKQYAFHGIGISSTFKDNSSVDFDFAFLPEQRHDGFDVWRLQRFVEDQKDKYKKYLDIKKLEADFNELIERELIVNPNSSPSTTLYFFKGALTKTEIAEVKTQKHWWEFWKL